MAKKHTVAELNQLYTEASSCDQEKFAEMRSNILLIAGDHYTRKGSKFWQRIKDDKSLNQEQKIRLTKNHVQRIHKAYVNHVLSACPGTAIEPHNEKELQDQKAAELHGSVWEDGKRKTRYAERLNDWGNAYCGIGEVHTKIFFDPNAGEFVGYEQEVDEQGQPLYETNEMGMHLADEQGNLIPKASDRAVFTGLLKFKDIFGFNLLRSPNAQTLQDSPYLIERYMADIEDIQAMIDPKDPEIEDKKRRIASCGDDTFHIFDANKASYSTVKNQALVKEFHFRKCPQYPKGYYYIVVGDVEIAKDEHPFGVFPIISQTYEKHPTAPRGVAPVKTMRPYQIEINRCASKIAEHHVTLGDDKLIMMSGSKLQQGSSVPGIRGYTVTGAPPTILPGRDGSQYLAVMKDNIAELYDVMMVSEMGVEKNGQLDPYAMLFKSASQKQKHAQPTKGFERFLIDVTEAWLELKRNYADENEIIPIIGKQEAVNISEFKNSNPLAYQIKVVAQAEDVETKMGKQLVLNHMVQYTAGKLDKQDLGKLMRLMPYANFEEGMSDLTLDYDVATNVILALDRGDVVQPYQYDNMPYMIKRLTARMRQADFRTMPPNIQQNYAKAVQQYEQLIVKQQQAIKEANADFIPTDGYLVICDFYVADPANPGKTRRARLPFSAIQWLVKRLEAQGASLEQLESMQQGNLASMAQMALQQRTLGAQAQGRAGAPNPGAGMPVGAPNGNGQPNPRNFDPRSIAAAASPGAPALSRL
jgi:hypothetical protein